MKSKPFLTVVSCAVMALVFCGGCGHKGIEGRWQLVKFCYGPDCIGMPERVLMQYWKFEGSPMEVAGATDGSETYKKGHQYQEGVMDQEVGWRINATGDTLFLVNPTGTLADTQIVTRLDKDTLVLSSMLNNIQVCQHFVRAKN